VSAHIIGGKEKGNKEKKKFIFDHNRVTEKNGVRSVGLFKDLKAG